MKTSMSYYDQQTASRTIPMYHEHKTYVSCDQSLDHLRIMNSCDWCTTGSCTGHGITSNVWSTHCDHIISILWIIKIAIMMISFVSGMWLLHQQCTMDGSPIHERSNLLHVTIIWSLRHDHAVSVSWMMWYPVTPSLSRMRWWLCAILRFTYYWLCEMSLEVAHPISWEDADDIHVQNANHKIILWCEHMMPITSFHVPTRHHHEL